MSRILALDIGTVRIGVAESDPLGLIAQGVAVWDAQGPWREELVRRVREREVGTLLLSLPRRTTGEEGPEAEKVRALARELGSLLPGLEILLWDERFTTVIAQRTLLEADLSRRKRRGRVDQVAATLLLQSYLDSRRPRV
jgi:putative Holliday junction resolvase